MYRGDNYGYKVYTVYLRYKLLKYSCSKCQINKVTIKCLTLFTPGQLPSLDAVDTKYLLELKLLGLLDGITWLLAI